MFSTPSKTEIIILAISLNLSSADTFMLSLGSELSFSLPNRNCWRMKTKMEFLETNGSVGSVQDLITGGRWFDLRLCKYSSRGLMIVIATRCIPLSLLSIVSTIVMWEAASGLERILCAVMVKRNTRKHG